MTNPSDPASSDLLFDRAIPVTPESVGGSGAMICANCKRSILNSYHTANGEPVCADCRALLGAAGSGVTDPAMLAQSVLFGLVAMLAGSLLYWAIMRIDREWAIAAIACGWMIGHGLRKGADGRGARPLQIVGALFVYLSVALAHFPVVYERSIGSGGSAAAAFVESLLIPALRISGGGVRGLLFALIVFFGMSQAWQLMKHDPVVFEGPFRVGGAAA